jgi:hypothetical protein
MNKLKLTIKVSPTENTRQWELLEDIWYREVKVPSGFIFDGASIPFVLRGMFPHGGKKFFASAIHDYCYRTGCISKVDSDRLFLKALLENGVTNWKAKALYLGVRYGGHVPWMRLRRKDPLSQLNGGR